MELWKQAARSLGECTKLELPMPGGRLTPFPAISVRGGGDRGHSSPCSVKGMEAGHPVLT